MYSPIIARKPRGYRLHTRSRGLLRVKVVTSAWKQIVIFIAPLPLRYIDLTFVNKSIYTTFAHCPVACMEHVRRTLYDVHCTVYNVQCIV